MFGESLKGISLIDCNQEYFRFACFCQSPVNSLVNREKFSEQIGALVALLLS